MIDLKTGLKIGQAALGFASIIPGAAPFALLGNAALGIAGQLTPDGGNKTNGNKSNPGAVDITDMYRTKNPYVDANTNNNSWFGASNSAQGMQDVMNNMIPYGGNKKDPNRINVPQRMPLSSIPTLNANGIDVPQRMPLSSIPTLNANGIDVPQRMPLSSIPTLNPNSNQQPVGFTNNIPVPDNYFASGDNNVVPKNPTDTRAIKRAIYGTDDSNSLLNFNAKYGNVASTNQQENTNTPFDVLKERETGIDAALGKVDTFNTISQGLSGVMGIASIINELNKKPSDKLMPPQYSTVNLDSNQSGAINYAEDITSKGKNAQLRMMTDLGIDPVLANTVVNNSVNTQMLGAYANAENTRQSVETQQAQLNANIESQANQSKLAVDQFNIKKQMQENQLASANISESLLSIAGSIAGIGQGKWNNFAMSEYLKNQLV